MADDTPGTLAILDGTQAPQNILVGVDTSDRLAYQMLLRANGAITSLLNPQPVQNVAPPLAYTTSTSASIGQVSSTLIVPGSFETCLTIQTIPGATGEAAGNVWLNATGGAAVVGQGCCIVGGGGSWIFGTQGSPLPTGPINAITDGGTAVMVAISGG